MGRELKRVPLNFKWPTGQVWIGYLNPYRCHECKQCDGSGLNSEMKRLQDEWYGYHSIRWIDINEHRRYNADAHQYNITSVEVEALVKAGRLSDLTGWVFFNDETNNWETWADSADGKREKVTCDAPVYPTTDQVNEWNKVGFGHDAINAHICIKARAKELGVEGNCDICQGKGYLFQSSEIESLHDAWHSIEPPDGEGYQLWETTSEGSPKSPVFDNLDSLCDWCAINANTFAQFTATKDEWKQMLEDGLVHHQEGNMIML